MLHPKTYIRKPFPVQAERVTNQNMNQVALWCGGELKGLGEHDGRWGPFIEVDVVNPDANKPRQSQAFVGDWVLKSDKGFKVYTNRSFEKSFDSAADHARAMAEIIRNETVQILDKALENAGPRIESTVGIVVSPSS